jgi:MOSC domain-containing protein YiiM
VQVALHALVQDPHRRYGIPRERHGRPIAAAAEESALPHALTEIEAEALEGLRDDTGIELTHEESRQVLTRGIALNDLLGKRFRVGEVECVGTEWCDPCAHLERLTYPGVLKGLVQRAGLRAEILNGGGRIAAGDPVTDSAP